MSLALAIAASVAVVAQVATMECHEPLACRELALEARARGAYEAFHDLAWRAVQTGRANDPDLMYLLARAQALSGRRRDALLMLRRLAEAGVVTDAATNEDFRRVRELSEWRYVESLSTSPRPITPERAAPAVAAARPPAPAAPAVAPPPMREPDKVPVATTPAAAAAAPAAVRSALRVEPMKVEEAARFSTRPFVTGGFAYDAVSRRLLFGDAAGHRVFVVGDGSDRTVDLVRDDSAGVDEVTAIAIDSKRGDLWVGSSGASGRGGAIHRLQLISGRAVARLPLPATGAARLRDIAITGDGTVLILDGATPRIFVRRPGADAVELLTPLMTPGPVSIAAGEDGRLAYVAHPEGITRIDVPSRRAAPLEAPKGITVAGFEFIRWHRDVLVGAQVQPDGSRGLVRLQLNRDRRAVTQATLIGNPASGDGDAAWATISGGDLYYLVAGRPEPRAGSGLIDVRVKRVKLP